MVFIQKKITYLILLFVLLLCSSVFAPAPSQVQYNVNVEIGYDVVFPQEGSYVLDNNLELNIHVINRSSGLYLTNDTVSCRVHVYNTTGHELFHNSSLGWKEDEQQFYAMADNTTFLEGEYQFVLNCNSTDIGGYVSAIFGVYLNGVDPPSDFVSVFFMLFFVLLIVLFFITLIKLVSTMFAKTTDLLDIAYSISWYFSLLSLYYFNLNYGGFVLIDDVTSTLMVAGSVTHVLLPLYAYGFGLIINRLKRLKQDGQT